MSDAIRRVLNIIRIYGIKKQKKNCNTSFGPIGLKHLIDWNGNICFRLWGKMNMGERFIRTVKILYEGTSAKILINGIESERFELHRGTRPGDPLSPLMFAFAIEPLAANITNDESIMDVTIRNRHHKINL